MQDTCLSCIPEVLTTVGQLFDVHAASSWQNNEPAISLLRAVIAPAVENASASFLAPETLSQPGIGKALDIILAEAVAGGLGNIPLKRYLHFVLGTCIHFTLLK